MAGPWPRFASRVVSRSTSPGSLSVYQSVRLGASLMAVSVIRPRTRITSNNVGDRMHDITKPASLLRRLKGQGLTVAVQEVTGTARGVGNVETAARSAR